MGRTPFVGRERQSPSLSKTTFPRPPRPSLVGPFAGRRRVEPRLPAPANARPPSPRRRGTDVRPVLPLVGPVGDADAAGRLTPRPRRPFVGRPSRLGETRPCSRRPTLAGNPDVGPAPPVRRPVPCRVGTVVRRRRRRLVAGFRQARPVTGLARGAGPTGRGRALGRLASGIVVTVRRLLTGRLAGHVTRPRVTAAGPVCGVEVPVPTRVETVVVAGTVGRLLPVATRTVPGVPSRPADIAYVPRVRLASARFYFA